MTTMSDSAASSAVVRVLHVEDSPADLAIVRRLLSRLGASSFSIDTAGSAAEALLKLESGRYDLVFLDNGLPDEEGLTLLRRVGTLGAPVIMLTGQEEIRQAALNAGAAGFVSKAALDGAILARAVAAVIGGFPGPGPADPEARP